MPTKNLTARFSASTPFLVGAANCRQSSFAAKAHSGRSIERYKNLAARALKVVAASPSSSSPTFSNRSCALTAFVPSRALRNFFFDALDMLAKLSMVEISQAAPSRKIRCKLDLRAFGLASDIASNISSLALSVLLSFRPCRLKSKSRG